MELFLVTTWSLLASLALFAVAHGLDGAGGLFGGGVSLFAGVGSDGGLLDVRGLEGAEVVGGFEAGGPGFAIHVAQGLHLRCG